MRKMRAGRKVRSIGREGSPIALERQTGNEMCREKGVEYVAFFPTRFSLISWLISLVPIAETENRTVVCTHVSRWLFPQTFNTFSNSRLFSRDAFTLPLPHQASSVQGIPAINV